MTPALPSWQSDPSALVGGATGVFLYLWLWRRGAGDRGRAAWPAWRTSCFLSGVAVALLALLSPLDGLADVLFVAHMLQHMLLMVVAPPLLLLGLPAKAMLRALPRSFRRHVIRPLARNRLLHRGGGLLLQPITVFCVFNGDLAVWHVPLIYRAAEATALLHVLEHLTFLAAGCLLWWLIVEPLRVWPRGAELRKIVFVAGGHLPMLVLGQFFLAFATLPLYAFNAAGEAAWSLTPLTDQRLGGGVMFGLDMLITFTTVSVLFGRYLAGLERRQVVLDEILASRH
ncbi:MAG TPA: cytochrome c oxidase assembly protein [Chloroflexota bacterium]|jgi:cytochrome c oxidase assembly factor CtaG|nr:cytochrome c oxidase assembly protein [Chloroflexota bacterium]